MDHHWKNYVAALASFPFNLFWVLLGVVYVTSRICDVLSYEPLIKKCIFAKSALAYDIQTLFYYRNPYSKLTYAVVVAAVTGVVGGVMEWI